MNRGPWLVTGASGFLGRHFLEQLHRSHPAQPALALVRSREEWDGMEWTRALPGVETIVGGVTAPERWTEDPRLGSLAGVVHLAAQVRHTRQDADATYAVNVDGTLAMVRLAGRARCRMLFVSTSGTVGCFRRPGRAPAEDAPYCEKAVASWPYYDSKIKAEQRARALAKDVGVELVIARPPVLLGPDDHRHRSTNHVRRFLEGKLPFLIRGGMHFADVRDVAAALVRLMARETVRPVYHLPGTACSIQEFYAMVAEAAGMARVRRVVPYRLAVWAARALHAVGIRKLPEPALVEMAGHYWDLSSKYSEAELGYRSREGRITIADTIAWLRQAGPARAQP
jgi:nucleoside-diphosphate-sugar epimerase